MRSPYKTIKTFNCGHDIIKIVENDDHDQFLIFNDQYGIDCYFMYDLYRHFYQIVHNENYRKNYDKFIQAIGKQKLSVKSKIKFKINQMIERGYDKIVKVVDRNNDQYIKDVKMHKVAKIDDDHYRITTGHVARQYVIDVANKLFKCVDENRQLDDYLLHTYGGENKFAFDMTVRQYREFSDKSLRGTFEDELDQYVGEQK